MRRYCVNLSDEAAAVWFAHQAKTGLKRDPALEALLLEFGGKEPVEPEEPTRYDVEVSISGDLIWVRSGLKTLLSTIKSDAANAFQVAVNAVPSGGSLGIGEGTYELPALYPVALNADGSNIFYCCIQILDKSMHIHGAGQGKTVLKLAAWQQKQLPGGAPSPLLADASVPPIPSLSKVLSSLKDAPIPGRRPLCNQNPPLRRDKNGLHPHHLGRNGHEHLEQSFGLNDIEFIF